MSGHPRQYSFWTPHTAYTMLFRGSLVGPAWLEVKGQLGVLGGSGVERILEELSQSPTPRARTPAMTPQLYCLVTVTTSQSTVERYPRTMVSCP